MPAADQSPTPVSRRTALRLGMTGLAAGGIGATALSTNRIASALEADPSPDISRNTDPVPCSTPGPSPISTPTVEADADHFYTTKDDEYREYITERGYQDETSYEAPYVLNAPVYSEYQGLLNPFYRLYNEDLADHFYTPFEDEVTEHESRGYVNESDVDPMWVFLVPVERHPSQDPPPGLQQLFHLYNEKQTDSFFTTKLDEAENAVAHNGYTWQWRCRDKQPYLFTSPALVSGHQTVRLYRTFLFIQK